MNTKIVFVSLIALSFIVASPANAAFWSGKDLIAPDSNFSFLQNWKESIQTFLTFGAENKVNQYLHLTDVRLNEYKQMLDQGKTDIAAKVLEKYQKQLDQALAKAKEFQDQGKDTKDLSQKIEDSVLKHIGVLQENLQKAPEQAKKGLENAIENSQKGAENVLHKKLQKKSCKNVCGDGVCQEGVMYETCVGLDCPCLETKGSCPNDCPGGMVVGGPCTYDSYPGKCKITSVEGNDVKFSFEANDASKIKQPFFKTTGGKAKGQISFSVTNKDYLSPVECIRKYGIKKDAVIDCQVDLIKTGTCTPVMFKFNIIGKECLYF